jgi:cyanoexosortase B-associated protein
VDDPVLQDAAPSVTATPVSRRLRQIGLVVFLAMLLAIAAVPRYLNGTWPWQAPLPVPQLSALQDLLETPLSLPGWRTLNHEDIRIGGDRWALTEYEPQQATPLEVPGIALLLRPQTWHKDQPEVEWVDIAGSQTWRMDRLRRVQFTVPTATGPDATVTARYLRSRNDQATFAVLQWYGWPQGGNPSPNHWFWLDQWQQWRHGRRQPWVAVSIIVPIEPVGDIAPYQDALINLGQTVQTALLAAPFAGLDMGGG